METFIRVTEAFSNKKLIVNISHIVSVGHSSDQSSPGDICIKLSTGDIIEIREAQSTLEEVLKPLQ